eukprot:CAMPEP_0183801814 /NCGR_PEP_ID=MMETSP0803_2-20130417/28803_1 /TAXON_ID=195967 /ORGANISM="Crustomastix stigmata, Strain CCMP3273" /LENGTH=86 /DNA_ID=CAMNT_0026046543 /DNA_START=1 /DNA_END=258 /DNA_ORIENTATION=+
MAADEDDARLEALVAWCVSRGVDGGSPGSPPNVRPAVFTATGRGLAVCAPTGVDPGDAFLRVPEALLLTRATALADARLAAAAAAA